MQDISKKKLSILMDLIRTKLSDITELHFEYKSLKELLLFFEAEYDKNPAPKTPKKSTIEKARWLKFRDQYLAQFTVLSCHYCNVSLKSDAPRMPCKTKDHIFKRNKSIPKNEQATIDHVVPLSKGGAEFDPANFVVACHKCNGNKADKSLEEFKGDK